MLLFPTYFLPTYFVSSKILLLSSLVSPILKMLYLKKKDPIQYLCKSEHHIVHLCVYTSFSCKTEKHLFTVIPVGFLRGAQLDT